MDVESKYSKAFYERRHAATAFLTEVVQHIVQTLSR